MGMDFIEMNFNQLSEKIVTFDSPVCPEYGAPSATMGIIRKVSNRQHAIDVNQPRTFVLKSSITLDFRNQHTNGVLRSCRTVWARGSNIDMSRFVCAFMFYCWIWLWKMRRPKRFWWPNEFLWRIYQISSVHPFGKCRWYHASANVFDLCFPCFFYATAWTIFCIIFFFLHTIACLQTNLFPNHTVRGKDDWIRRQYRKIVQGRIDIETNQTLHQRGLDEGGYRGAPGYRGSPHVRFYPGGGAIEYPWLNEHHDWFYNNDCLRSFKAYFCYINFPRYCNITVDKSIFNRMIPIVPVVNAMFMNWPIREIWIANKKINEYLASTQSGESTMHAFHVMWRIHTNNIVLSDVVSLAKV